MDFTVTQGDIVEQSAGALVNSTNTRLQVDTEVGASFREAAGPGIVREIDTEPTVEPGDVAVTDAYDLDAEWVIHAAAIGESGEASELSVATATENALERAEELGLQTVAIPALGTREGGLALDDGTRAVAEVIDDFDADALEVAELVAYTEDDEETIRAVARSFDDYSP